MRLSAKHEVYTIPSANAAGKFLLIDAIRLSVSLHEIKKLSKSFPKSPIFTTRAVPIYLLLVAQSIPARPRLFLRSQCVLWIVVTKSRNVTLVSVCR